MNEASPPLMSDLSLLASDTLQEFLDMLAESVRSQFDAVACIVWWRDKQRNGYTVRSLASSVATAVDAHDLYLPFETAFSSGLPSGGIAVELTGIAEKLHAARCLAVRLHYDKFNAGALGILLPQSAEPDAEGLTRIAADASMQCCRFERLSKNEQVLAFIQAMSDATYERSLAEVIIEEGKKLFSCDRAVIRRVNLQSGHLEFVHASPKPKENFHIPFNSGVTGKALADMKVIRIDDVTDWDWKDIYQALWSGSRSELAAPVILPNSRVRIGSRVDYAAKPLGVLNFESTAIGAFSKFDESCALAVANHAARVMDRLDFDAKLAKLHTVQRQIATKRDWESIVDVVLDAVRDTLGYEFVNLSLVNSERGVIRSVRVLGIPNSEEFRRDAVHQLDSSDIQADIVRTRKIEVLGPDDSRLDPDLLERFGLKGLIRVWIPMLGPTRQEVVGTISAGYDRTHRKHIYERDIQILKGFVDFAAAALESWRRGVIDRVSHEINAPLTAVRANLSFLRRRWKSLPEERIERALEDMQTDSEILSYQVQQLEYVLGGRSPSLRKEPLRVEPVLLFRDIIFKTINQLKPMVRDKGLDPARIDYDLTDVYKVKTIHVDKLKLSQVIFNLFMNAVKYSESPESFQIRIAADERPDSYIIKFSDWGVGVPEHLRERIFEDGFRAPAAVESVSGSGLGLTIARALMREHGGDVILFKCRKPTEFHIIIPKRIPEGVR